MWVDLSIAHTVPAGETKVSTSGGFAPKTEVWNNPVGHSMVSGGWAVSRLLHGHTNKYMASQRGRVFNHLCVMSSLAAPRLVANT